MTDTPESLPPLPREADRRVVEDADARGMPLTLAGGERWFIPPLPLSPRGQVIATLLDSLTDLNVDAVAAQRTADLLQGRLEACQDEDEIGRLAGRLKAASEALARVEDRIATVQAEVAWNALRTHYKVTREESDRLINRRHWRDVLSALQGRETEEHCREVALAFLKQVGDRGGNGSQPSGPFDGAGSSGTPARS
jgi:hypothetical protein